MFQRRFCLGEVYEHSISCNQWNIDPDLLTTSPYQHIWFPDFIIGSILGEQGWHRSYGLSWLNWFFTSNIKSWISPSPGSSCKSERRFQNGNCALCSFRQPELLLFFVQSKKMGSKAGFRRIFHCGNDSMFRRWLISYIFSQGIWTYWYKIRCYKNTISTTRSHKKNLRQSSLLPNHEVQHVKCGCVELHAILAN